MKTEYFQHEVGTAPELIRKGGLVAVPTETVYGLAGSGLDEQAVAQIYEVKGRPAIKPLSLMVSGSEDIEKYCVDVPEDAYTVAEKFWPGPVTIVLKNRDFIPPIVLAGGSTVGLRCPDSALTLELIRRAGVPLAAPSANPSGEPSPKNAEKVRDYFDGKIDGIIDGGPCVLGVESTLINMSVRPYRILRAGAVSEAELADCLREKMTVIGITGGTGCGKTTALRVLGQQGALVVDCDAVYHELLENSAEMIADILAEFPEAASEGRIDRKILGGIVFSNQEKLLKLNEITHGHVVKKTLELLRSHAMNGGKLAAIDAYELSSSGLGSICNAVIVVDADEETRVGRIMARDGIDREYALARIHAQKPGSYFRELADYVIENNSDEEYFIGECRRIFEEVINNGK